MSQVYLNVSLPNVHETLHDEDCKIILRGYGLVTCVHVLD